MVKKVMLYDYLYISLMVKVLISLTASNPLSTSLIVFVGKPPWTACCNRCWLSTAAMAFTFLLWLVLLLLLLARLGACTVSSTSLSYCWDILTSCVLEAPLFCKTSLRMDLARWGASLVDELRTLSKASCCFCLWKSLRKRRRKVECRQCNSKDRG